MKRYRYDRYSIDYQINIQSLEEMEEVVPMTIGERGALRQWVRQGHELDSNPWNYSDADGYPLNYLQAFRLNHGYLSGPWDDWKGPETQPMWDENGKQFRDIHESW